jgi:hypothetical protein
MPRDFQGGNIQIGRVVMVNHRQAILNWSIAFSGQ